jgi:starch phosphorylase
MAISGYYLIPPMPEGLEGLAELGLDLRWSWSHETDYIWELIDPELWRLTRNPWLILQSVSFEHLRTLAEAPDFRKRVAEYLNRHRRQLSERRWFAEAHGETPFTAAYFSMEFGLSEALPIYSGGLGILAGDYLKTACDLGVPVVGVGLLYQQGYFRQVIDESGAQTEYYSYNDPNQLPILPLREQPGGSVHHGRALRRRSRASTAAGDRARYWRLASLGTPRNQAGRLPSERRPRGSGRHREGALPHGRDRAAF